MKKQKQPCKECGKKIESTDFLCPFCGRLPVKVSIIENAEEMLPLTENLNTKINLMRDFFDTLNLTPDDERNQLLGSLNQITGWLHTQLIIFTKFFKTPNSFLSMTIRRANPDMTKKGLQEIVLNFDKINRLSYLTHFLFRVEIFLKRISETLLTPPENEGYKNLVKHVLKELGMRGQDGEKYRILYFPAIVRNSLHNAGIYDEDDTPGKIKGINFKFIEGKGIRYASWRNLYFFYDNILDVLEEILKHKSLGNQPIPRLKS